MTVLSFALRHLTYFCITASLVLANRQLTNYDCYIVDGLHGNVFLFHLQCSISFVFHSC
jgi:hypothetical protein